MKKSIGIITINDYDNYGNRLQNYATQEILKSMEVEPKTIVNSVMNYMGHPEIKKDHISVINKNRLVEIVNIAKLNPIGFIKKINMKTQARLKDKSILPYKMERFHNFKEFTSLYIETTEFSITDKSIPFNLGEQFDYFVTGSDQVWNPYYRYGSSIDFLTFAPKDKRIALSPSFGISNIPSEFKNQYSTWLKEMKSLSIREEAGAYIIKEMTGRDAEVLIDPTLMLEKDLWLKISKEASNKPEKKYLLTYFLDDISKSEKKWIKEISKRDNLEIRNLKNIKDLETYKAGPSEFIDYINDASIFLTNSFHGVIFAVLLETPFIVFDRNSSSSKPMNSRIDTLLKIFKLENRQFKKNINDEQIYKADYQHIDSILKTKRNDFSNYLKKSMNL